MTYLEWNNALAEHFFSEDSSGKRIFLSVTRDTLAGLSGMDAARALEDFLGAVKQGPEWTNIPGSRRLVLKAMNCLYPDPSWRTRYSRGEKRDLSGHVHWTEFADGPRNQPPFLAYLACFVLAWTERPTDFNGNDYYGPLNKLLKLTDAEQISTTDFGPNYQFRRKVLSTKDIWQALEVWSFERKSGVLYLPTKLLNRNYVDIPKYFGLLKAQDLKNLDSLFAELEEISRLIEAHPPTPERMVHIVSEYGRSKVFLTKTCLSILHEAIRSSESAIVGAYGALLCSKYRDFDGVIPEESKNETQSRSSKVRLLRVLDPNGRLKLACRLRSDAVATKLPLAEGVDYIFKRMDGSELAATAQWVSDSPWFRTMDLAVDDILDDFRLACDDLTITARSIRRPALFMHRVSFYHLQSCQVEADELNFGQDYVVLTQTASPPVCEGIQFAPCQIKVPAGFSCWKTKIPATLRSVPEDWPPLAEERMEQPSVCIDGLRLEPKSRRFALQCPLLVSSSHDGFTVFIKSQDEGIGAQLEPDGNNFILRADRAGVISLALHDTGTLAAVDSSEKILILEDIHASRVFESQHYLVDGPVPPKYPVATLCVTKGTLAPQTANRQNAFLAVDPPIVSIESRHSGLRDFHLIINGEARSQTQVQLATSVGLYRVECRHEDFLLDSVTVELIPTPEIAIIGLSVERERCKEFADQLSPQIIVSNAPEERVAIEWQLRAAESSDVITKGTIETPHCTCLLDFTTVSLKPETTYQIEFKIGQHLLARRWFKVRQPSRHLRSSLRAGSPFNNLADAFSKLNLSQGENGGER